MSSIPGYTLEKYVGWLLNLVLDESSGERDLQRLTAPFEPWRELVESRLLDFDEERHSWRGYAGSAFEFIPDEVTDYAMRMFSPVTGTLTPPSEPERHQDAMELLQSLRDAGLTVAVHNDYRLHDTPHTFYLMTDANGRSYKGEGLTDWDALRQIQRAHVSCSKTSTTDFQVRVDEWMLRCFGLSIAKDLVERSQRLLEEVLELIQTGPLTRESVHAMVDYVYDRPLGDRRQELGGVMVTLATYASAAELSLTECGEQELSRIQSPEVMDGIYHKQLHKPRFQHTPSYPHSTPLESAHRIPPGYQPFGSGSMKQESVKRDSEETNEGINPNP